MTYHILKNKIDVSIIIVNYNTRQMTSECIESIFQNTKHNTFEIILIDNASADGSKNFFRKDTRINYIYLKNNIGFGRANNIGIENANGKYIFLLNSDTILMGDIIKKLFEFAEKHIDIKLGALGTCLIDNLGKDNLSFSEFPTPYRIYHRIYEKIGLCKSYELKIYKELEKNGFAAVDHITGADLFIPKTVVKHIGKFDPSFFMYFEETDLEKRMANAGYTRIILNLRKIIHLEGGSFKKKRKQFQRDTLIIKSMNLYIRKHFCGIHQIHIRILIFLTKLPSIVNTNYTYREKINLLKLIIYG